MEETPAITAEEAQRLLDQADPPTAEQSRQILRFLKRANDDLLGKLRQLKSEIGRVARR